MDYDLSSRQEARDLARKAQEAQKIFNDYTEEEIDRILVAMVNAIKENGEWLARMAVDETKYGIFEHKVVKNQFASEVVYESIKDMKTRGIINEDKEKGIIEYAAPVGVVCAIVPTTNPTSTIIHNSIVAIKAGNAIVFCPHPTAARCSNATIQILHDAVVKAGAPEGLISGMTKISMDGTDELMKQDAVKVIVATGGPGLVKAAYSAGKPAFGVGAGNVPVFIERTADVKKACADIINSKSFDCGMICASEQSIILDEPIKDQAIEELKKNGGYFMTKEQVQKVSDIVMTPTGGMRPGLVGKTAKFIAEKAGFNVPEGTRILIAPLEGYGPGYPLSYEKLTSVLNCFVVDGWEEGCELSIALLNLGGIGHTAAIHSQNEKIIREFVRKPASRIVVNTPSALGGIGYTTGLNPSLTLGCGTWGGSSISENLAPHHLVNVNRLAYGIKDYCPNNTPKCDNSTNANCSLEADDIAAVVRQVLSKLQA